MCQLLTGGCLQRWYVENAMFVLLQYTLCHCHCSEIMCLFILVLCVISGTVKCEMMCLFTLM